MKNLIISLVSCCLLFAISPWIMVLIAANEDDVEAVASISNSISSIVEESDLSHVQLINDDFCDDIVYGSDEPNTSACSFVTTSFSKKGKFQCNKDGQTMIYLAASRIHDGKSPLFNFFFFSIVCY